MDFAIVFIPIECFLMTFSRIEHPLWWSFRFKMKLARGSPNIDILHFRARELFLGSCLLPLLLQEYFDLNIDEFPEVIPR
jgi:hypothetical protein